MHSYLRQCARLGAAGVLLLAGTVGVSSSHQALARQNAASGTNIDWLRFGNTTDNTRYAQINQINASNVSQLGLAWTQSEGPKFSTFETDPVVVNGIMYYTTNADQVRAVNAATGKLIWQYTPKVNFYLAMAGGGGGVPTNRGVEVIGGKVYLLTFDNQLIGLQATTGEKLWSSQVADPNQGYSETSPATYWNGMLFVGSAESDAGKRGFVAAYSATTGKQIWRYFTVPADGQGWVKKGSGVTGGDVWMPQVIDTKTGMLYFGTGNPFPDFDNSKRPGCNPWVNATVALNARTGKFVWGHSEVCNDINDMDSHQPPMIFDVMIKGKMVHAVGHGNKTSLYYVYDAATGKVLAKSDYLGSHVPQHGPGSIKGVICPGADGGFEYSPPAFSPITHYAYEPGLNFCFSLKFTAGGLKVVPYGKVNGFFGAIDTATGKVAWKTIVPSPMVGGAVATSGNLVFSGSSNGHFYAFDATNGKILWDANVGLAVGAAPITYQVNGVQYVALAVGGFSSAPLLGLKGPFGGTMMVFKLHGSTIVPAPAVDVGNGFPVGGLNQEITTKGLTRINQYVYMDAKTKRAVFRVVGAANNDNNGFNFDGYSKGKANFVVPPGWHVDFIFTNNANLPHSVAIVPTLKISASTTPFAATPNPIAGITAGKTQYAGWGLAAPGPGKYYMVCLVPGHITAGMWNYFTVDFTAKAPSLQVSK